MTRFSGSIWLPSETIGLLAEAAREHECSISRHAELCIAAACRIMGGIYRDVERIAARAQTLAGELHLSLDSHSLQVIGARSIDAGVTVEAFTRAILIHAVWGYEEVKPVPPRSLPPPGPKKAEPGFRKWHAAKVIHEPERVSYSMGDPPPGRSALDRKRAMEAGR